MGYCVGGVIAQFCCLVDRARRRPCCFSVASNTLLDYCEPGPLGHFVSEDSIESIRKPLIDMGYLLAELMLRTFASLRPHNLLFDRVLNSYVLGQRGKPFFTPALARR